VIFATALLLMSHYAISRFRFIFMPLFAIFIDFSSRHFRHADVACLRFRRCHSPCCFLALRHIAAIITPPPLALMAYAISRIS